MKIRENYCRRLQLVFYNNVNRLIKVSQEILERVEWSK